ncbi:hypothetical protein BBJ28_00020122 [Nothophytophthora sp. Chile5]|nr:hypothetical protein BBJ28_00020122 [Nothophytophthora sp. Chile5]
MVSKLMRHQTAGGQATGAEAAGGDRLSRTRGRSGRGVGELQTGKHCVIRDVVGTEIDGAELDEQCDDDEDESEPVRPLAARGNQLGELADSERVFPAPTSHVAALNRELKALEVRYFRTRLHLEKKTEKHLVEQNDQLRSEMKKVATHNTKLEREISKLRHLVSLSLSLSSALAAASSAFRALTPCRALASWLPLVQIDRIQSERKQLEQQAISNRDYAKKIEHRFFMGTKGQSLAQCNLELSSRVRSLENTLKQRDEALQQSQRDGEDARGKLGVVQRALETRLETYELNGSLHTGLLFEISRLQDHGEALALQLVQERKQSTAAAAQLESARHREETLEDARAVRETWVATLEKERAALDDQLAQLAGDAQTAACEKATLLRFVHEQAEAKFQLEARLKDEQAERRQEVERMQHALQFWEEEKQRLQLGLQTAQQDGERQREEHERVTSALREQREANAALRTREHELQREIQRLEGAHAKSEEDFLAAKDVCRELQAIVEQHEDSGRLLRSEIDALESTRRELLEQLETRRSEERALREAMEGALQDLAALSRQRNDAAKAMSEAVTISASSLEEQQTLERQVEAQRTQLEKLKNAKNLLQNAMLEQLAALRKQLHVERRQRIEAEARLKQLQIPPASNRHRGSAMPPPAIAAVQQATEARRPEAAGDWDAPQPLPPPSSPSPSPAPLPSYLSMGSSFALRQSSSDLSAALPSPPSSSSSSSVSSNDEEDACEAMGGEPTADEYVMVSSQSAEPVAPLPYHESVETKAQTHLSLLELAGDFTE